MEIFFASLMIVGLWVMLRPKNQPSNQTEKVITEIVVRAFWINFWVILAAFFLTFKNGYSFTLDPIKMTISTLVISASVQAIKKEPKSNNQLFNKPKLNFQNQKPKTPYQEKYVRLLSMLGGDKEACDRLIARYGIDKAIYDLERDRDIR